jgi:hypothetical protein
MKTRLIIGIVAALLASSAQRSQAEKIEGQVFIVTNAQGNVKLGRVEVRLYDAKQVGPSFKEWQNSADLIAPRVRELAAKTKQIAANAKEDLDDAIRRVERGEMPDSYAHVKARISGEADALQANAENFLKRLYSALGAFTAFAENPIASTKTDADGNFSFSVAASGHFIIIASTERKIGDERESYFWAVRAPGEGGRIDLSNDNTVSSGSPDSAILAVNEPVNTVTADDIEEQIRDYLYRNHFSKDPPSKPRPKIVTITESVQVDLPGSSKSVTFGRGRQLPFVTRNGDIVIVRYLDDDVTVPVSSTDLR